MSKDTHESALDKGSASPVDEGPTPVVPSVKKWRPADRGGALFHLQRDVLESTIRERVSRYQKTDDPISQADAVALARCIRNLYLSDTFDGHAAYLDFLAGQCLKLKEGQTVGEVFTATVMLKAKNPPPALPEWRGPTLRRIINLAVPAELDIKPAAFGAEGEGFSWLSRRSEDFARDYARKGCTHGSPASRLFDGGDVGFILDRARCSQPEPDSIPVVPAPDEATIAQYIKRTVSSPDHWDALHKAATILLRSRQPLGDALSDWILCATDRKAERPDGRKADKTSKSALRKLAIDKAVDALARCGMMAMTSDREPGPACDAVARAFTLEARTVLNIRKSLKI